MYFSHWSINMKRAGRNFLGIIPLLYCIFQNTESRLLKPKLYYEYSNLNVHLLFPLSWKHCAGDVNPFSKCFVKGSSDKMTKVTWSLELKISVVLGLDCLLPEDKDFLSCLQLAHLFANTVSLIEGKKQRFLFSILQLTQFLLPSFLIFRKESNFDTQKKNRHIEGSGKTQDFLIFPCELRQPEPA